MDIGNYTSISSRGANGLISLNDVTLYIKEAKVYLIDGETEIEIGVYDNTNKIIRMCYIKIYFIIF